MADRPNDEALHLVKAGPDQGVSGSSDHIEQLISSSSVLELEAGVQVGLHLLEDLKTVLNAYGSGNSQVVQWLQYIQQVEDKANPAPTIVGVIGVTGAGKSSLINAVLDEERLVPTSGIRACTASATEISYNHSDDPNELYRAEVEFISVEEWSRELKNLLGDLIDGTGNISQECNNPDTEAGLAYSKIKAVYPQMTREGIVRHAGDSAALAQQSLVRAVLGSVKRLRATSSQDIYEGLQKYIDSKEKRSTQMEYWPLIKVVRIYCKAAALSTGIVLVDLPGVQDSNAARAAVAENYIKMCSGLWITAGIDRAINNKVAQKLLGNGFKRQLKYDGAFSGVTFICTKTDDVLESEVEDSLQIKAEVGDYWEQIQSLGDRREKLNLQIEGLKKQKVNLEEQVELLEASFDQWEELQEKHGNGEPVYRPPEISKKRKRKNYVGLGRKTRGAVVDLPDSDDVDDSDDAGSAENSQAPRDQKTSLTEEEIQNELDSIKIQKKQARKSKKNLAKVLTEAEAELAEVGFDEATRQSQKRSLCIRGRNKYSKDAIKQDFALGIKELDQDLAIEQDELNFDPDEEIRDYDEVARGLAVFCVSARAYQKLAGRLEKDAVQIDGFASLDDTEIPQLQEHAKRLTESGRISTGELFLNELSQLLNSLRLWTAGTTRTGVSKNQTVNEKVLSSCFMKLDNAFRQGIKDCHEAMQKDLQEQLYKTFDRLVPMASANAVETATGWGEPRPNGGLFWGTYKATCRRDGKFSGSSGLKDFNAELFEPINKQLAGAWERTFQQCIPSTVRRFIGECKAFLDAFHNDVANKVTDAAANSAGLIMLDQQKRARQNMLDKAPKSIVAMITEYQREANRGFIPVIQEAMQPGYDACVQERGRGTYVRMKSTMESHVDTKRNTMFRDACCAVQGQLEAMCAVVEAEMTTFVNDLFTKLQRDYLATLVGGRAEVTAVVPLAERMLHEQVRSILDGADSRFAQFGLPASGQVPAAAVGLEQDEDLIAQQLEDRSETDTLPGMKQEQL